eukprot:384730_1
MMIDVPITYKKNGGYTLELNQNESIWQLKSLYYGLIAYGMPQCIKNRNNNNRSSQRLNDCLKDCVWSIYFEAANKKSLIIDKNVKIEAIQLSDGMMNKYHLKNNEETD